MLGEAVEIEAVIPVRAADERQSMGTFVGDRIIYTPAQVLHKGLRQGRIIIEGHGLAQNSEIPGLSDISADCGDKPERVVVKAASDICIALLGEGLVLMVSAAVRELRGSDVDDPFPSAGRDQVNKAEQILTGIAKSHSAADSGLIVGGAS